MTARLWERYGELIEKAFFLAYRNAQLSAVVLFFASVTTAFWGFFMCAWACAYGMGTIYRSYYFFLKNHEEKEIERRNGTLVVTQL